MNASGGTAVAAGGSDEGITFDQSRTGGFRSVDATFNYLGFIAEGPLDDTLTLTATGTNGVIDVYEFDDNEFGFDLEQAADTGDTLSAIGAPDTFGIIPVNYSFFAAVHEQSLPGSVGWVFVFTNRSAVDMNAINEVVTSGLPVNQSLAGIGKNASNAGTRDFGQRLFRNRTRYEPQNGSTAPRLPLVISSIAEASRSPRPATSS